MDTGKDWAFFEVNDLKSTGVKIMINNSSTGIYIAYPTSEVLKRTYRGHKSFVNNRSSKVGITKKCLSSRQAEYMRTFDGELRFIPLAGISPHDLPAIATDQRLAGRGDWLARGVLCLKLRTGQCLAHRFRRRRGFACSNGDTQAQCGDGNQEFIRRHRDTPI